MSKNVLGCAAPARHDHVRRPITWRLRLVVAASNAVLSCLNIAPAQADDYPWCVLSDSIPACDYQTYEQCRATAAGIGACVQNPRFAFRNSIRNSNAKDLK
jgi:Protein of unknown function (DUF3551)